MGGTGRRRWLVEDPDIGGERFDTDQTIAGPPDFFRIEEAAAIPRIGRTAAYGQAHQFLASQGTSGLPVVRVGKQLRVPRWQLERMLGGPITWPPPRRGIAAPLPTQSRMSSAPESTARRAARSHLATLPFSD